MKMNIKKLISKSAVSMIETLMVIMITGILLSIIIPGVSSQKDKSAIATTKSNLAILRTAVDIYYQQENAWPNNSLSRLWDGSAPSGTVYLPAIPVDAIHDSYVVVTTFDGSGGWHWDNLNHKVFINQTGMDKNGDPFSGY